MFRYRMSSKTPMRGGWVLAVLIIGLLLIIIASQIGGQREPASQPVSTNASGSAGGALIEFWDNTMAGFAAIWNGIIGKGPARQVELDLNSSRPSGSGDDEEEDAVATGDVTVDVEKPLVPDAYVPAGQSPQVLIYHTHTHEAYTKLEDQDYVEVAKWRTDNNMYNIVRVGEALALELSTKYGIAVLQDKTDTEYPQLGTSYSRSLKTVQKDMQANKDLKILIDLHRDAYNKGISPSTVTINGKKVARIMFVIGTGVGQTGVGFTERPDWKKNLALADAIKSRLMEFDPNLVRETSIKTGRYNQHLSTGCILIEVGHNENTLEEALNAVPYLAQAIAGAYNGMAVPVSTSQATASPTIAPSASPSATAAPTPSATACPSLSPTGNPLWPFSTSTAAASPSPSPGSETRVITID